MIYNDSKTSQISIIKGYSRGDMGAMTPWVPWPLAFLKTLIVIKIIWAYGNVAKSKQMLVHKYFSKIFVSVVVATKSQILAKKYFFLKVRLVIVTTKYVGPLLVNYACCVMSFYTFSMFSSEVSIYILESNTYISVLQFQFQKG